MPELSYREAVRDALSRAMREDDDVFVMGEDIAEMGGSMGVTQGMLDEFGPERVRNTPISEMALVGAGIGAAMAGMRPIHVHIRMDFLMLCMNQLINMAAKSHYMYGGQVKVPMVVRSMIGKSWGQGAQHSQGLHAMFMHVPGLKVAAPSNAHDAKGALIAAIRDDNPVIFVEHRLLYPTEAAVPEEIYTVEPGRARIWTQGRDVTIVGISNMVVEVLRAAELLHEVGIEAEVVDPIWLQPLDCETIIRSVERTGRLLVVDNAWVNCGASAEIAARVAEALGPRAVQTRRIGFAPTTCPPSPALEQRFYPNPATIAQSAHEMVRPDQGGWVPDASRAMLAYQQAFRGPF